MAQEAHRSRPDSVSARHVRYDPTEVLAYVAERRKIDRDAT
ncbi:hypothetical protein ACIBCO_27800 [Streptomyces violascens]